MPLGYGVIGSPTGSGPVSLGSSPGTPAVHVDSADVTHVRACLFLGRDIGVGLEDTTVLAHGRVASGNGELVEAAVRLAAELSQPS